MSKNELILPETFELAELEQSPKIVNIFSGKRTFLWVSFNTPFKGYRTVFALEQILREETESYNEV